MRGAAVRRTLLLGWERWEGVRGKVALLPAAAPNEMYNFLGGC